MTIVTFGEHQDVLDHDQWPVTLVKMTKKGAEAVVHFGRKVAQDDAGRKHLIKKNTDQLTQKKRQN